MGDFLFKIRKIRTTHLIPKQLVDAVVITLDVWVIDLEKGHISGTICDITVNY